MRISIIIGFPGCGCQRADARPWHRRCQARCRRALYCNACWRRNVAAHQIDKIFDRIPLTEKGYGLGGDAVGDPQIVEDVQVADLVGALRRAEPAPQADLVNIADIVFDGFDPADVKRVYAPKIIPDMNRGRALKDDALKAQIPGVGDDEAGERRNIAACRLECSRWFRDSRGGPAMAVAFQRQES